MITRNEKRHMKISRPALFKRGLYVGISKPGDSPLSSQFAELSLSGFAPENLNEAEQYALAILEAVTIGRQLDLAHMQKFHGAGKVNNDHMYLSFEETGHDYSTED